jgi:hypothetical protein
MELSNHDQLGQAGAALRSGRPRSGGDVESAVCGRIGRGRCGGGRRTRLALVSVGRLGALSAVGVVR